ncbi:hypothetical protein TNCV_3962511 [Trichonephila clavipes]|nr:hypothetical protein TNCV_3962511 [Trichonephila clavipes]
MRLQERKGTVDGYEWRCRNQSKDNRHDVVWSIGLNHLGRSPQSNPWYFEKNPGGSFQLMPRNYQTVFSCFLSGHIKALAFRQVRSPRRKFMANSSSNRNNGNAPRSVSEQIFRPLISQSELEGIPELGNLVGEDSAMDVTEANVRFIRFLQSRFEEIVICSPLYQRIISSSVLEIVYRVFPNLTWGCGSPVVKTSDNGRHAMSSSPVPLKTRRVGQRCMLNLSRADKSSRWRGKRRAWFLPDDPHTASLVRLRGGWRHFRKKLCTRYYGSNAAENGCAYVRHASTDFILEPKCINCSQLRSADSKLCPKSRTGKQIHEIKTKNSQANISNIRSDITTSNSLSTSAASSSSTVSIITPLPACPVLETTITTSNAIPATSQDAKQTSKPRNSRTSAVSLFEPDLRQGTTSVIGHQSLNTIPFMRLPEKRESLVPREERSTFMPLGGEKVFSPHGRISLKKPAFTSVRNRSQATKTVQTEPLVEKEHQPWLIRAKNSADHLCVELTNYINNLIHSPKSPEVEVGAVGEKTGTMDIAGSTGIGKGTTFVMARFKIPVEVFTLTTLTRQSLPGEILQEYAP